MAVYTISCNVFQKKLTPNAYQVVLGVVVWEGVHVVGVLAGGLEVGLVEGQGADLVEVQGVEDEALDPLGLRVYQEVSRMEEHLKTAEYIM